jgi:predicted transposase YbfD/YdcC
MAVRQCEIKGKKSVEKRYFISSLKDLIEEFSTAVRKHWGIESTHWFLNVVFKEDSRRVRKNFERTAWFFIQKGFWVPHKIFSCHIKCHYGNFLNL